MLKNNVGFLPDQEEEALSRDGDRDGRESAVPVALVLVLRNLRVFGHFENALLLELVRSMEHVTLRPGERLFRVGDPDRNMFVVESGAVRVFCSEQMQQPERAAANGGQAGTQLELKTVGE